MHPPGNEGIYRLAIERGDLATALVAAVVLSEHGAQCLLYEKLLSVSGVFAYGVEGASSESVFAVPGRVVDTLMPPVR